MLPSAIEPLPSARTPFAEMTVGAHRLALLRDGVQAFPAMLDAIASARSTVCMETYILRDDPTGRRFADALAERARAGVEVNLLYDAWGSSVGGAYVDALQGAGVRVLAYHPIRFAGRRREVLGRLAHRDHRKALIVDSRIGFTGGINVTHDYAPVEEGGAAWRDTHIPSTALLRASSSTSSAPRGGARAARPSTRSATSATAAAPDPLVSVM